MGIDYLTLLFPARGSSGTLPSSDVDDPGLAIQARQAIADNGPGKAMCKVARGSSTYVLDRYGRWDTAPPNKELKLTKRGQLRSFAA
jgi:hypothetical protein